MKSDIDVLALNSIYFISQNNHKYGLQDSVLHTMIKEVVSKYSVQDEVNWQGIDGLQKNKIRHIYKISRRDPHQARKLANDALYETSDLKEEAMCEATVNLQVPGGDNAVYSRETDVGLLFSFTTAFSSTSTIKSATLRTCLSKSLLPPLTPFLKESKHIKLTGNAEEATGSKHRKKKNARMSDHGVKVVCKEFELHLEVKGPGVASEDDNEYHPAFIKKIANPTDTVMKRALREALKSVLPSILHPKLSTLKDSLQLQGLGILSWITIWI